MTACIQGKAKDEVISQVQHIQYWKPPLSVENTVASAHANLTYAKMAGRFDTGVFVLISPILVDDAKEQGIVAYSHETVNQLDVIIIYLLC